jgi:hypothetical protein
MPALWSLKQRLVPLMRSQRGAGRHLEVPRADPECFGGRDGSVQAEHGHELHRRRSSLASDVDTLARKLGELWRVNLDERRATIWMRSVSRRDDHARDLIVAGLSMRAVCCRWVWGHRHSSALHSWLRISAIVDAEIRLIVDGVSA